jgi:hypothetical protein
MATQESGAKPQQDSFAKIKLIPIPKIAGLRAHAAT